MLLTAAQQLDAYFYCDLRTFDLPLAPAGTAFQQSVWEEMLRIPYGRTCSYADMARELDSGPRAIGGACARNPIPIIIPCHRVLASGQRIGGYSSPGGLDTKQFLLQLEGVRLRRVTSPYQPHHVTRRGGGRYVAPRRALPPPL